jgi:hypothetical protein
MTDGMTDVGRDESQHVVQHSNIPTVTKQLTLLLVPGSFTQLTSC